MKRILSFVFVFCSLALAACFSRSSSPPTIDTPPVEQTSEESSSTEGLIEDATVEGTVEKAGISIYMEGSHRLMQESGEFLLLESSTVDLNGYMGEHVAVTGDVRSTTEAGGKIMDVQDIRLSDDEEEQRESSSSTSSAPMEALVSSVPASSMSSFFPAPVLASSRSSIAPHTKEEAEVPSSSSLAPKTSTAVAERIERMSKDDFTGNQWTQQYCSSHIGFCTPVHRNWWFKSFGTTTSTLWHIELGPEALNDLGDGPLVINLMSGNVAEKGVKEGDIAIRGDFIVGYRAWTENRHFEISGPLVLGDAVRYMTEHLEAYASPEAAR